MALSDEYLENNLPSWIDTDAAKAYAEYEGLDDDDFSLSDFEDAYSGHFNSDEEFAENMAEELGLIESDAQWPYTCIDWERAARELMFDYFEQDGYYFRRY